MLLMGYSLFLSSTRTVYPKIATVNFFRRETYAVGQFKRSGAISHIGVCPLRDVFYVDDDHAIINTSWEMHIQVLGR